MEDICSAINWNADACTSIKKSEVQQSFECQCDGEFKPFKIPSHFRGQGQCTRDSSKSFDELNVMSNDKRWWTRLGQTLFCPLTNFPIHLLPYPPFKFRLDPEQPAPNKLIDGKFLAMQVIVKGRIEVCGRKIGAFDIAELDQYMQRCKLGGLRPSRAFALMRQAAAPQASPEHRKMASQDLESFTRQARYEMGKLRRIQEKRLSQAFEDRRSKQQEKGSSTAAPCA
jgi:hypothetical protein